MIRRSFLAVATAAAIAPTAGAAPTSPPKRYFVLLHSPGPRWDHAKGFRDQSGIDGHVGYMEGYAKQGRIVLGGPFLDDSGGMMIFEVASQDEARRIAEADPTVAGGLLAVSVRPWLAVFSRG